MSDNSVSFVPRQSNFPDNKVKAKEILDWLVLMDIVKPTLTDCILSSKRNGYSISEGARKVTDSSGYSIISVDKNGEPKNIEQSDYIPIDLITNGLDIITERTVFDTGEIFIDELICPNCKENIAEEDWDLNPWSNQESDNLTCTQCGKESEIHNYYIWEPDWGFSNLGFTFWNWPDFTDEFIDEFKKKLGCEISIVFQHI